MKKEEIMLTHAQQYERALGSSWRTGDLPALTTIDRIALRVGLVLILWGRRHAGREDRDAQQRQFAADRAAAAARDAFERRTWSGPSLW